MYDGGCARYIISEQIDREAMFERHIYYVLAAVGSGLIIALVIAICTTH